MKLIRTTSDNTDFQQLVIQLDHYLKIVDGEDHEFYAQFNKTGMMKNVVVCYENGVAVGCGAFKEYEIHTAEIKRMFVLPEHRKKGIASKILAELEVWAHEEKYTTCILETGIMQQPAISLYQTLGYSIIENYGQYKDVENSICMKKDLK
ncbi:GNAT family N-acetyltransferase [Flavobacterium sp.]|uniref:GNAT family N-acetyltransferase n=1 Tax=Flavobacterium sp. TaxID=239 RepID=UPI003D6C252E